MPVAGGYMHSNELLVNDSYLSGNKGCSYIELQPGLAVYATTANDLNATDVYKGFASSNNYLCFSCQLQGKLNIQVKARKVVISQGGLTFGFANGETFYLQHSKDFCNLEVMVMPQLLNVLLGDIAFQFSCLDNKLEFFLHHYQIEKNTNVLSCARQLFHLMQNTDCKVTNRLLLYAHVLEYLNWYFKIFDSQQEKQQFSQREYLQLNKARDYLLSDLSSPPTIDWLARRVGLNTSKLKKGFKQVFGKSIYAYFLTERMYKAKQLLMANSVTETAILMGYSNVSHFSAAFRKQFGVLPKEMRRQHSSDFYE